MDERGGELGFMDLSSDFESRSKKRQLKIFFWFSAGLVKLMLCSRRLKEFNLEKTIERKPRLVLSDELAHTNAQGMRHEKRWQNILEVLENGIDVYTTVNVQHIESLNDKVASITRITVNETVPVCKKSKKNLLYNLLYLNKSSYTF